MRTIREIAREIREDWKKVSPYAEPYLQAMAKLETINSVYGCDSASSIVLYFLSNAQSWRGAKAREIKKELKKMVDDNDDAMKRYAPYEWGYINEPL